MTKERVEVIKAMDTLVRCINDEDIFESWLYNGVPDGTIKSDCNGLFEVNEAEIDETLSDYYGNDEDFKELLSLFLRLMYRARKDGLYCDGVLSDTLKIKWE